MQVTQHITEALSSQPVGTFLTVAEISDAVTNESLRAGHAPSRSAVSARLLADHAASSVRAPSPIPGVTVGNKIDGDESTPLGARRSA